MSENSEKNVDGQRLTLTVQPNEIADLNYHGMNTKNNIQKYYKVMYTDKTLQLQLYKLVVIAIYSYVYKITMLTSVTSFIKQASGRPKVAACEPLPKSD